MTELLNPLRFSLRDATIDVGGYLSHEDDDIDRRVTELELKPSEGNVYVHWEEA